MRRYALYRVPVLVFTCIDRWLLRTSKCCVTHCGGSTFQGRDDGSSNLIRCRLRPLVEISESSLGNTGWVTVFRSHQLWPAVANTERGQRSDARDDSRPSCETWRPFDFFGAFPSFVHLMRFQPHQQQRSRCPDVAGLKVRLVKFLPRTVFKKSNAGC